MLLNDQSLYRVLKEYILLLIQAADTSIKNDHTSSLSHADSFSRRTMAFIGELHVRYLEYGKEMFLILTPFLDTKVQQLKMTSYPNMSLFISKMVCFDLATRDRSKRWISRAAICDNTFDEKAASFQPGQDLLNQSRCSRRN